MSFNLLRNQYRDKLDEFINMESGHQMNHQTGHNGGYTQWST